VRPARRRALTDPQRGAAAQQSQRGGERAADEFASLLPWPSAALLPALSLVPGGVRAACHQLLQR
jgi:hypothetical protein